MTRHRKKSAAKAGIEPRSATLEEETLTTRPMRRFVVGKMMQLSIQLCHCSPAMLG